MLKKSLVILLLPLYFLASLESLVPYWTLLHRTSFRLRARRGELEEPLTFHFTKQEYEALHWEEKGKEFELKNKMYDVTSIEVTEDGFIVKCYHDKAESLIKKVLNSHSKKPKNSNKRKIKTFKYISRFDDYMHGLLSQFLTVSDSKCAHLDLLYENVLYDIESPPPELA